QLYYGGVGLLFPLVVAGIGVIASVVGILTTRLRASDKGGLSAINRGFFISAGVSLVLVLIAALLLLPSSFDELPASDATGNPAIIAFVAVLIGIVLAVLIQQLTGYFTDTIRKPVQEVGRSSLTGPA